MAISAYLNNDREDGGIILRGVFDRLPPAGRPAAAPVFAECYGGVMIGHRGGIICKGTQLHVPLMPS
jgi:hypothetical protein